MSDLFSDFPDADPREVPVTRRRGRAKPLITKLGSTAKEDQPKKKVNLHPQQRAWFTKGGWTFENVETRNPYGGNSSDLFGIIDYIAARKDQMGVLFVQVTTTANTAARRKKILASPVTPVLLAARNTIQIHSWHQPKGPGTRWEIKIEDVTL
mgnify:CR=1 FL=1